MQFKTIMKLEKKKFMWFKTIIKKDSKSLCGLKQ